MEVVLSRDEWRDFVFAVLRHLCSVADEFVKKVVGLIRGQTCIYRVMQKSPESTC